MANLHASLLALLLSTLPLTALSRRQQFSNQILEAGASELSGTAVSAAAARDNSSSQVECGSFPTTWSSSAACGGGVTGSLIVGCVSAQGLKNVDWLFGVSDPFCRVRLVDAKRTESRGWWNSYKKFVPVSETFNSKTINNNLDPVWNEAVEFKMMCPQHPDATGRHRYQLEVYLKDGDMTKSNFLGAVHIPFDDILGGRVSGIQNMPLKQNQADSGDSRSTQGNVKIVAQWCPTGDSACVQKALRDSGSTAPAMAKRPSVPSHEVDCEQRCTRKMKPKLGKIVDDVIDDIKDAIRADEKAEHYDDLEDHYEELEDHAEDRGDHHAEEHFDDLQDHYEDLEEHYEDQAEEKWKDARKGMSKLIERALLVSRETCGPRVGAYVGQAEHYMNPPPQKKFKGKEAKKAISQLKRVKSHFDGVSGCIHNRWSKGEFAPLREEVSPSCAEYYQGH